MLYDPKWERPAKTASDPSLLKGLINWLEQQPPDTEYQYYNCDGGCLIGLYGTAVGLDWNKLHSSFYQSGLLSIASKRPRTFGGALERARAACG